MNQPRCERCEILPSACGFHDQHMCSRCYMEVREGESLVLDKADKIARQLWILRPAIADDRHMTNRIANALREFTKEIDGARHILIHDCCIMPVDKDGGDRNLSALVTQLFSRCQEQYELRKSAQDYAGKLEQELARLRKMVTNLRMGIHDLLQTADCEWERQKQGHDWPLACENARELLETTKP